MHSDSDEILPGKPSVQPRWAIRFPADRSSPTEKDVILSRVQSRPFGVVFRHPEDAAGLRAGPLIAYSMSGPALSIYNQTEVKKPRRASHETNR
jgi:hypothetical protein